MIQNINIKTANDKKTNSIQFLSFVTVLKICLKCILIASLTKQFNMASKKVKCNLSFQQVINLLPIITVLLNKSKGVLPSGQVFGGPLAGGTAFGPDGGTLGPLNTAEHPEHTEPLLKLPQWTAVKQNAQCTYYIVLLCSSIICLKHTKSTSNTHPIHCLAELFTPLKFTTLCSIINWS